MAILSVRSDGGYKTAFMVGLSFFLSLNALPSHAQTSYVPWAVGSSLLQPLRYFTYSPWGGTGYSNPLWYGGKILQQSTRGVGGGSYGGYSPYGNPNFYAINGDEHGLNQNQNPGQGSQQVIRYGYPTFNNSGGNGINNNSNGNNGGGGNFNNASSNNNGSNSQSPSASGTSAFEASRNRRKNGGSTNAFSANGAGVGSSNGTFSHSPDADPFLTPPEGSSSMPSAPRVGENNFDRNGQGLSYKGSSKNALKPLKMGKNAPFASSFIDTVNNKYNGDIQSALSDQNTRAMAHNLGLIGGGNANLNLSEERKSVIGRIMHDDSLDAASKMAAVKALLH